MNSRNAWRFGITAAAPALLVAGVIIGCTVQDSQADTTGPQDVRVQDYSVPGFNCKIFTHDTMQGASVAVACR